MLPKKSSSPSAWSPLLLEITTAGLLGFETAAGFTNDREGPTEALADGAEVAGDQPPALFPPDGAGAALISPGAAPPAEPLAPTND